MRNFGAKAHRSALSRLRINFPSHKSCPQYSSLEIMSKNESLTQYPIIKIYADIMPFGSLMLERYDDYRIGKNWLHHNALT